MCLNKKNASIFSGGIQSGMPAGASEGQGTSSWDSSSSLYPLAWFFPAVACPLKLADPGMLTFAEEGDCDCTLTNF